MALSRFLCTTALEETWRDDRPVLFLGEWCRRHARKDQWSKLDAAVMSYHWDDRARLQADYRSLLALHERLLPQLAAQLNRMLDVDRDVRYWRILAGPWLGLFVQILYDRWASIRQSVVEYGVSETIVLCGHEESLVPNDMADFHRLFLADEWNHHIYARVLQHFPQVSCRKVERSAATGSSPAESAPPWSRRSRQALTALLGRAVGLLARDRDAFFLSSYLPLGEDVRLQLGMGQVPQRWHTVLPVRAAVDPGQRDWVLDGQSESQFEACVRELIPAQIPTVYLEGYRRLIEQTGRLAWPRRPRLIFTSNGQWADDVFKAWAAEKVSAGAPLVIGQHGGHLGSGRWSFVEDHDVAISDRYLSWGWTDPQHPNVRATCQLKARRPLGVHHAKQARALLVTGAFPRFSYWMYSVIVARQWLDYFEDQCAFVAHLPAPIRGALTVRLYPDDYGWDQVARWRERMPDVRLDRGESKMDDLIRESRLYISTYNATTYLESLTMDVPTVIYWNPRHWELRDSAIGLFEDLRRIGVFHETPESAARHVAEVWDDIDAWWSSPAVREVLHRFIYRYCRVVDDVAAVVDVALREVETAPRLGMAL